MDTEKIAADYRNGVLRLRIPVAEKAKPRKIVVDRPADAVVIEGENDSARGKSVPDWPATVSGSAN